MSDISDFLGSEQRPSAPSVSRRFGEVLAVNAGPPRTIDVELAQSGITIPAVPILASYGPIIGDSVVVDFTSDAPLAMGATGGGGDRLIESVLLIGALASVTFSTIPQHFGSLRIVFYGRSSQASTAEGLEVRFNGDVGANYDRYTADNGGAAVASLGGTTLDIGVLAAANVTANTFGVGEILIPHYANTANHKTADASSSFTAASNSFMRQASGKWRSTAAITSLLLAANAGNLVAGSRFDLYGLA